MSAWNIGYNVRVISSGQQIGTGKIVAISDRKLMVLIGADRQPTEFKIMCDRSALSTGAPVLMARPL